eukprot:TRINITY_DN45495_c0_g1_i1.p1 TRINITY_DN45495_c0_g1~~TRINITY_DN45495_c0_g1_i1.p1  ORF type:complete len:429 (+),score=118.74 TRINITY_DN45495_c0_g1_i1:154-1440(+)
MCIRDRYLATMRQNNLADFWSLLVEATGRDASPVVVTASRDSPRVLTLSNQSVDDVKVGGWRDTLLKVDGRYHVVVSVQELKSQILMLSGVRQDFATKDKLAEFIEETTGEVPRRVMSREDHLRRRKFWFRGRWRRKTKQWLFFVEISSKYVVETKKQLLEHGIARRVRYTHLGVDGEAPQESSVELRLTPDMVTGKQEPYVEVIGYIGSYLHQHLAIEGFLDGTRTLPTIADTIVDPLHNRDGDYASREVQTYISPEFGYAPINDSQRSAVENLSLNMELVQGPPGTGKSAMILHMVRARVPDDQVTLVTSVCNEAIGSICCKLRAYHSECRLLVLGNTKRVAAAAVPFTLEMQVEGHAMVQFLKRYIQALRDAHWLLTCKIRDWELSLIHISEPTRLLSISYAVFCLKKKKTEEKNTKYVDTEGLY